MKEKNKNKWKQNFVVIFYRHFMLVVQIHLVNKFLDRHEREKILCRIFSSQQKKVALKLLKIHIQIDQAVVVGKENTKKKPKQNCRRKLSNMHLITVSQVLVID